MYVYMYVCNIIIVITFFSIANLLPFTGVIDWPSQNDWHNKMSQC